MYSFPSIEPLCYSMSSSNCCFLTCMQVPQKARKMLWYSHFFKSFPQFVMIHTVRVISIVDETEVDVFLEFPCFFYDPMDVGSLSSDSSSFSKPSLYTWKFWFMYCWSLASRILSITLLQYSSVQLLSQPHGTAACLASLSITNSQSLLKLMSIALVMPSNHLILCRPLLLLPSIFPSIRVFSKESVLHIRWPKYWSFSFSISPSNEYSGLISSLACEMRWLLSANGKPLRKDGSKLLAATESGQGTSSIYANSQIAKNQHRYCEFWRRKWHPTPVLLPGKSHGWRSLVGYSPWGHKESDTTERLHFTFTWSWITKMKIKAQWDTTCSICVWEEYMFCSC